MTSLTGSERLPERMLTKSVKENLNLLSGALATRSGKCCNTMLSGRPELATNVLRFYFTLSQDIHDI